MSTEKQKTKAGKIFQAVGKFVKGKIKGIPGVALGIDLVEIITKKDIATGAPKDHDKIVWLGELIGLVAVIAFLVHKGIIPQDVLLKVIEAIINSI